MGVYSGVTDDYLTQSDQTRVADAVKKYSLWSLAKEGDPGRIPALDLNFAENKSLVDNISGNNLITFTRSSVATYVDTDGLISIASTDTPRFDHDPETGESLGLLIEEERTNLITHSTSFSGITTGTFGSGGTLPTGWVIDQSQQGTNLDIVDYGTENGLDYIDLRFYGNVTYPNRWLIRPGSSVGLTTNISYHSSCYAKLISGSTSGLIVQFSVRGGSNGAALSGIDTDLKRYDGNWTATSTGTYYPRLDVGLNASSGSYDLTIRFAAPQAEEGSFLTSYIPTSGSSETRNADVAEITGTNFSNWYNQDEGTVFSKYGPFNAPSSGINPGVFHFNSTDANSNECIDYFNGSVVSPVFRVRNSAVNEVYTTGGDTVDKDVQSTAASAYKVNDFARSLNGNSVVTDTSGLLPSVTPTFVNIGSLNKFGIKPLNGSISRFTYWPVRLSNSTLQSITE